MLCLCQKDSVFYTAAHNETQSGIYVLHFLHDQLSAQLRQLSRNPKLTGGILGAPHSATSAKFTDSGISRWKSRVQVSALPRRELWVSEFGPLVPPPTASGPQIESTQPSNPSLAYRAHDASKKRLVVPGDAESQRRGWTSIPVWGFYPRGLQLPAATYPKQLLRSTRQN